MSLSKPQYHGPMEPVYPCPRMPTRHCPAAYESVCGDRPCARYESDDPMPWFPEIAAAFGAAFGDGDTDE